MVYAGTAPSRLTEVRTLIAAEVDRLLLDGVTDHELSVAKGYLEGSLVLGLEDSGSRMARLGSNLITRDKVTDIDEHLRRIANVTGDDVDRVIAAVLSPPASVAAVGPLDERDLA